MRSQSFGIENGSERAHGSSGPTLTGGGAMTKSIEGRIWHPGAGNERLRKDPGGSGYDKTTQENYTSGCNTWIITFWKTLCQKMRAG